MRRLLPVAAALCTSVAIAAPASAQPRARVLATAASAASLPAPGAFVAQLAPGLRVYRLNVPNGTSARDYARELERGRSVFAAQPDIKVHRAALAGTCADAPDVNALQALPTAVNATTLQADTTPPVAVLDTGIDSGTKELAGRVRPGINATNGSTDTTDSDGHGTEVAAVVAAAPGRFQGVSPTTPLIPVTIYTKSSDTTSAWVTKGISSAVSAGAAVINLSSSSLKSDVEPADADVLQQAIIAALDKGTITVASAGNEGKGEAAIPGSLTHVLTVGSSNTDGTRDAFSNFGPWLDLMSPGANLIAPAPLGVCLSGYGNANGTSFSAPAVAGAAALIKALRPTLDAQQLFDVMRSGAVRDLYGPGRDDDSGFGLLDVTAGVNAKTPLKQATEIDDDVFWIKGNRKKHPTLLRTTRTSQVKSAVAVGKDPQDVFPISLRKGETVTATVTSGSSSLVDVSIWSPRTGSFDIGKGRTTYLLTDSGGFTNNPQSRYRAPRTGTYYVDVEVPDIPDASSETVTAALEARTPYTLKLRKAKTAAKKKKKSKKK